MWLDGGRTNLWKKKRKTCYERDRQTVHVHRSGIEQGSKMDLLEAHTTKKKENKWKMCMNTQGTICNFRTVHFPYLEFLQKLCVLLISFLRGFQFVLRILLKLIFAFAMWMSTSGNIFPVLLHISSRFCTEVNIKLHIKTWMFMNLILKYYYMW